MNNNNDCHDSDFSLISFIRSAVSERSLSQGARLTLVELRSSAGYGVDTFFLVDTLSKKIGVSRSTMQSYLKELKDKGFVVAQKRTGKCNVWTVTRNIQNPGPLKSEISDVNSPESRTYKVQNPGPINNSSKDYYIENVNVGEGTQNVIEASPSEERRTPPSIIPMVNEIERITKDIHSRRAFIKVATNVDESEVRYALDQVRYGVSNSTIHNPGAYFLKIVKDRTGFSPSSGFSDPRPNVREVDCHEKASPPLVSVCPNGPDRHNVNPGLVAALKALRENRGGMPFDEYAKRVAEVTSEFGDPARVATCGA